jgi:hypothetical protein
VVEEALRTGSWEALRQWAVEKGWSAEKISRFIESLQHRLNADAPTTGDRKPVELVPPAELVLPDDSQRRFMPPPEVPSVPDQSSTPDVPSVSEREATTSEQTKGPEKQHPAHPQTPADPAGGPSDHGASKPGGWMRDQSPQPPRGD